MDDNQYVAEFNAQNPTAPVDAAPVAAVTPEVAPAAPAAPQTAAEMFNLGEHKFPVSTEFTIAHGGKVEKVPYSKIVNTWRQASHLEDKYKKFNTESEAFRNQQADFQKYKGFHDKYGALQEWSESKPEEFKTIWEMYQNRGKHLLEAQLTPQQQLNQAQGQLQQGQANGLAPDQLKPFIDKISQLEGQVGELSQFKGQFDQQQKTQQEQADVAFVKTEMETFQKRYPEINLHEKDPDGVSLWARIIQHGVSAKIPTFKAAALDYLEDRVLDTVSSRARNQTVQGIKTEKANGIVARSSKPFNQGQSAPINPKKVTWNEAGEMAKAQYAQLVAQGN